MPLQAQEADDSAPSAIGASGVSIRLHDLSGWPMHTTVDRFEVQVSNLLAATTYQVVVTSSVPRALGIGGCGTASQTRTVTGVTAQDVALVVSACAVGEATVTAEVRRTGAPSAEVSVSQRLTVVAVPENAIGPTGEPWVARASGAVGQASAPGSVPNTYFDQRTSTSVRANWGLPSDGGATLSGYGLLFWQDGTTQPRYRDALVVGPEPKHYTFSNLRPNTTYNWRIHACNVDNRCGIWTVPIVQVTTGRLPAQPRSISVDQRMSTSARVNWSPDDDTGGVPLTGFGIRWREDGGSWPTQAQGVVDMNARSHSMTDLKADTTYEVSLQSCNGDNGCSDWTDSVSFTTDDAPTPDPVKSPSPGPDPPVSTDPECPAISATAVLPTNVQVDVVPQPRRRASLCWSPSLFGESYFVQATDNLSNLHDTDRSDWHQIQGTMEQDHVADKAQRLQLNLDQIMTKAGTVIGLAENAAYGIRIGMRDDQDRVSYTKAIIIIDTPITVANGNSAGSNSAELGWTSVRSILNDTSYTAGTYDLRYRPATADHAKADWRPTNLGAFVPPKTNVTSPLTLTGLAARQVYAIQLIYRDGSSTSNDSDVFAARDSYVWPSATSAAAPESSSPTWVAGIPLRYPLPSTTYEYRICEDTFPVGKQSDWSAFIQHAFEQWELATGGVVTMTYSSEACTDYSNVVNAVLKEVRSRTGRPDTSFYNAVDAILKSLRWTDIRPNQIADSRLNEVIMLDDIDWDAPLSRVSDYDRRREFAFSEFAKDLGFGLPDCWGDHRDNSTIACAFPTKRVGYEGYTTDIFLRRTKVEHDPLALPGGDANVDPGDISFNTCPAVSKFSVYGVLVHEAGHALGIRSRHGDYSTHPAFSDTVMTKGITKVNCSPHPLDVLAMRALYQSR